MAYSAACGGTLVEQDAVALMAAILSPTDQPVFRMHTPLQNVKTSVGKAYDQTDENWGSPNAADSGNNGNGMPLIDNAQFGFFTFRHPFRARIKLFRQTQAVTAGNNPPWRYQWART